MTPLLLILLAGAPEAHAQLAGRGSAVWGDVGGGLAVSGAWDLPEQPGDVVRTWAGGTWTAGFGGVVGRYDDAFAIGRGVGFGVRARQDLLPTSGGLAIQTTVAVEAWRAIDLLVVSLRVGALAGPLLQGGRPGVAPAVVGGTARVLGSAAYRFHRHWSVQARLEAGADLVQRGQGQGSSGLRAAPAVGVVVGLGFTVPVARPDAR
ncbi:MAG: hypothetical protein H6732_03060 [Alphaproteobacteria bacterium]|nr:hypothetical protein [Alphaproteobacteria bacterium]